MRDFSGVLRQQSAELLSWAEMEGSKGTRVFDIRTPNPLECRIDRLLAERGSRGQFIDGAFQTQNRMGINLNPEY